MTVYISVDSRPGWSQRIEAELHTERVEVRMHKIACHEANKRPNIEVIVRATDGSGRWSALHWPPEALSYWVLT